MIRNVEVPQEQNITALNTSNSRLDTYVIRTDWFSLSVNSKVIMFQQLFVFYFSYYEGQF